MAELAAHGASKSVIGGQSITLIIPGLFSNPSDDAPALETALARAQRLAPLPAGLEPRLFRLFDIPLPADADLPVAALARLGETGRADAEWWLQADPVYLLVEGARLILVDRIADLPPAEAQALADDVLSVFGADGWRLETAGDHWYLCPGHAPALRTSPLAAARGQDVHAFLPGGTEGRQWQAILNEIQMLLHTSAVNAAREARGTLPVNSLWLWGGGRLPAPRPSRWAGVWGNHVLSRGLALHTGAPVAELPLDAATWLQVAVNGEHLLILDEIAEENGREILEAAWIVPLLKALRSRDLVRIVLMGNRGQTFAIGPADLRRWWRRRRSLQHWIQASE